MEEQQQRHGGGRLNLRRSFRRMLGRRGGMVGIIISLDDAVVTYHVKIFNFVMYGDGRT